MEYLIRQLNPDVQFPWTYNNNTPYPPIVDIAFAKDWWRKGIMLASLLLPLLFAWSVPAGPSVSLPSFNRRHLAEAYNESAELWSSAPLKKSSRVIDSLASDTVDYGVGCIPQEPPGQPQHYKPMYIDCLNAAWKIQKDGVDPRTSRNFSRHLVNPDRDYLVPEAFTWQSCIIYVDTLEENDYDMLSLQNIKDVALNIIKECLERRPKLGGKQLVGPKQVIKVLLFGQQVVPTTGTAEVS